MVILLASRFFDQGESSFIEDGISWPLIPGQVGAETAAKISHRTLDVIKTVDGDRLRFSRPV